MPVDFAQQDRHGDVKRITKCAQADDSQSHSRPKVTQEMRSDWGKEPCRNNIHILHQLTVIKQGVCKYFSRNCFCAAPNHCLERFCSILSPCEHQSRNFFDFMHQTHKHHIRGVAVSLIDPIPNEILHHICSERLQINGCNPHDKLHLHHYYCRWKYSNETESEN